ncbi:MAG: hypothetical protein JXR96_14290 [Deltaproteobacteria bacterium]|nr:hypothetical protein [Deltaproteobacteria bacterium]
MRAGGERGGLIRVLLTLVLLASCRSPIHTPPSTAPRTEREAPAPGYCARDQEGASACGEMADFCARVIDVACAEGLVILEWWTARLGEGDQAYPAAELGNPACPNEWRYLVRVSPGSWWTASLLTNFRAMGEPAPVDLPPFSSERSPERSISLSDTGPGYVEEARLAVRDGRLSIVGENHCSHDAETNVFRGELDWETLSGWSESYGKRKAYSVLLLQSEPRDARLDAPRTWITWGEERWQGPEDAALRVRVSPEAGSGIRVRLAAADDLAFPPGPAPSDRELIAADHFELWMVWPGCEDRIPDERGACLRQLAVALARGGGVAASWVFPAGMKAPLPPIRAAGDAVELSLPFHPEKPGTFWSIPFTAVFSDSDSTEGQQTLVATSTLRRGDVSSLGVIVALPGGLRFRSSCAGPSVEIRRLDEAWIPRR